MERFPIALACIILATAMPHIAFAEDWSVTSLYDGAKFQTAVIRESESERLLPGLASQTKITIENESDETQTFFLSLEGIERLSPHERSIAELSTLALSNEDGQTIKQTLANDPSWQGAIRAGSCPPKESITLMASISIPQDAGNEFALSFEKLIWKAQAIETAKSPEEAAKPSPTGSEESVEENNEGGVNPLSVPFDKTGYHLFAFILMAALIAATGIIFLVRHIRTKRKRKAWLLERMER